RSWNLRIQDVKQVCDGGQWVVDLMGDRTRKPADGGQFLILQQRSFGTFLNRDIAQHRGKGDKCAGSFHVGRQLDGGLELAAVTMARDNFARILTSTRYICRGLRQEVALSW